MPLFLLFLTTFASVSTTSAAEVKTAEVPEQTSAGSGAQDMANRLKTVNSCKDKVWPRFKLGDYSMYTSDHTQKPPIITEVDANSGSVKEPSVEARKYISEEGEKAYTVGVPSRDGKLGVAVNAAPNLGGAGFRTPLCKKEVSAYNSLLPSGFGSKDPTDLPMDILVHEAYHSVDQNSKHACNHKNPTQWGAMSPNRDIRADFATKSTVATYRAHMLHFLKKAAEQPGSRQQSISEALGWYKKLVQEFPDAVKELNGIDRREGSASYVGTQAVTIGKVGCNANSQARRKEFLQLADHRLSSTPQSLERQAYGLGAIAGLLLDEMGDSSWKNDVEAGKTPMEALEARAGLAPAASPNKVPKIMAGKQKFDAATKCFNSEALAPVDKAYKNPDDYIAVAVPVSGQFEREGDPVTKGKNAWMPSFSVASGDKRFQLNQWPVSLTSACGGKDPHAVVLVPKSQIESNGGSISFTHSGGTGHTAPSASVQNAQKGEMKTFDGFQMQCLK